MIFDKEEILLAANTQSPFYLNLPSIDAKPIDELIIYFKGYKRFIKSLIHYLKEIAMIKEFESNLNYQLINSFNETTTSPPVSTGNQRPNLNKSKSSSNHSFLKLKSINDSTLINNLNTTIVNHHSHLHHLNSKHHKELVHKLIPKLENLLKNLSNKIKEIKSSLKNDLFINDQVKKEISKTGSVLHTYMKAVELYNSKPIFANMVKNSDEDDEDETFDSNEILDDPFLIKLRLNYQLKHQLIKENYLFAAFINLQNISKDLLSYILKELYAVVERFEKISHLNLKSINFNANSEWLNFILNNINFLNVYTPSEVNPKREIRHFKDLIIPYNNSVHNKCIRFGIIYKKLKLLKNYNRFYYLLTCNYLHEFKIEDKSNGDTPNSQKTNKLTGFIDHNDYPIKSYNLNNYKIVIKNEKNFKFNLVKISSEKQTTLKCNNLTDFNNWYNDLKDLLRFESNHDERFEFVERKLALRDSTRKPILKSELSDDSSKINATTRSPPSNIQLPSNVPMPNLNLSFPSYQSTSLNDTYGSSSSSVNTHRRTPLSYSLNVSENPVQNSSLQGVFTPNIRTPSSSGSDKNPFDSSFLNSMESSLPSNGISPSQLPSNGPLEAAKHEDYLKLQQHYLKQQQDLINSKLMENENHLQSNNPATDNTNPQFNSYPNSSDSLKSLDDSKINNFLQQNGNPAIPKFFINDQEDGSKSDNIS